METFVPLQPVLDEYNARRDIKMISSKTFTIIQLWSSHSGVVVKLQKPFRKNRFRRVARYTGC